MRLGLRNADGVEVALVSQVPTTVESVDGIAVALGPGVVELADHVVARGVIVLGLKILRVEETILVSKLHLLGHNLGTRLANAKDRIVVDRHHGGLGLEGSVTCDHLRETIHHDRLLHDVLGLTVGRKHELLTSGLLLDDHGGESGGSSQDGTALNLSWHGDVSLGLWGGKLACVHVCLRLSQGKVALVES